MPGFEMLELFFEEFIEFFGFEFNIMIIYTVIASGISFLLLVYKQTFATMKYILTTVYFAFNKEKPKKSRKRNKKKRKYVDSESEDKDDETEGEESSKDKSEDDFSDQVDKVDDYARN